ncbi:putative calcium-binding protein CML10 [Morella rubra]|uniref:Putative calcium-binding protein CML10 n=1 Tax=Morella rubra TaxID=262757 RepID=A0A6A1W549_9ROSI|nr:putative calcium-binding protein CML10 [Morella rubra]
MVRLAPKALAPTQDVLLDIFKKHDVNGDGRLCKAELREAFKSLGSRAPNWRAGRGLYHADANRDGLIDEAEMEALSKYASEHGYTVTE